MRTPAGIPTPVTVARPEPGRAADPLARATGYSIASARKIRVMAECHRLKSEFQAGCRDYVRRAVREKFRGAPRL